MRRFAVAALAAGFVLLALPAAGEGGAPVVFESEHYALLTDLPASEARPLLRVLEAFHRAASRFYGRAPRTPKGTKLAVKLYTTRERFAEAMRADGLTPPESGGMYAYSTRAVYLFVQPTAAYTRHLLVHECAHQFLHLSVCRNDGSAPKWLDEGLAEYFGNHVWTGEELVLGRPEELVRLDGNFRLLQIKRHLADPGWKFAEIFEPDWKFDYADAWGVVNFMLASPRYSKKFRNLLEAVRKRGDAGSPERAGKRIFKSVYRREPKEMYEELRAYYADLEPRYRVVWTEWDGGGARLAGFSKTTALLRFSGRASEVSAFSFTLKMDCNRAGAVVAYRGPDDFVELAVERGGTFAAIRRVKGGWKRLGTVPLPAGAKPWKGPVRFEVELGEAVRVRLNGEAVKVAAPMPDGASFCGVFAEAGRAEFEGVKTTGRR